MNIIRNKIWIVLALFLSLSLSFSSTNSSDLNDFENEYKLEIYKARNLYKTLQPDFQFYSEKFKTDSLFLAAIIFPELIRFSVYQDFFETTMLEFFYIKNGAKSANFSIGIFQMKPGFIELLEREVKNDTTLKKYDFMLHFKIKDAQGERKERLSRLKQKSWQIVYLNCFYHVVQQRFKAEKFHSINEKLAFFATAYNHGFLCSADEVWKWSKIKSFPNGISTRETNFVYSDIAYYFYNNLVFHPELKKF